MWYMICSVVLFPVFYDKEKTHEKEKLKCKRVHLQWGKNLSHILACLHIHVKFGV